MIANALIPTLLLNLTSTLDLGTECRLHFQHFLQNVQKEVWAAQMLDSSTKIPDGVLYGNLLHMGNYDECVGVLSSETFDGSRFRGQYCSVALLGSNSADPSIRFGIRLALCTPTTCNQNEVVEVANAFYPLLIEAVLGPSLNVSVLEGRTSCTSKDINEPLGAGAIVVISLTGLLAALVVLSTALDLLLHPLTNRDKNNKNLAKETSGSGWWRLILQPFSGVSTYSQLFSTRRDSSCIDCLHGIRFISMLMVLMGHRYNEDFNGPITNGVERADFFKKPLNMIMANAYIDVETFLFLSGLLVGYNSLKQLDAKKYNVLKFYVYRYLRLTAPFAFVLLFSQFIPKLYGEGPLYEQENNFNCANTWYAALLYYQNYNSFGNYCITNAWYLCVDMHLALLSPLIVLPLHFFPRIAVQVLILLVIASCFIPFAVTYVNELFWALNGVDWTDNIKYTELMYFPTHTKATPYLCGLLLAYFLCKYRGKRVKINKIVVALMWAVCLAAMASVIMTLAIPYQDDYSYNRVDAAFYAGFHPLGWSICVAFVISACTYGYGGVINAFFSWKKFIPFSRLCYGAYLVQFWVIRFYIGSMRAPIFASHFNSFHNFLGDLPLTLILAGCLYFLVEAPTMKILRQLLH